MEKLPCSIFNDVLGPVMRGPSSSHVAGAARIASMIRQSLDAPVKKAIVDFDVNGALAASHTGHGTDMGFASGLLNMELDAPDVAQYEAIAKERGLEIEYRIVDYLSFVRHSFSFEILFFFSQNWFELFSHLSLHFLCGGAGSFCKFLCFIYVDNTT